MQINSSRGNMLFSNNNNDNQFMGPNLFQNAIQKNNYGVNNNFFNVQSQQNVFQKGMKVQK